MNLDDYARECHAANMQWWKNPATGEVINRNFGELIALCHSELSESLEGHRKNLMDDKLPQYPMWQVEIIDALIREFDLLSAHGVPVEEIFRAKMAYNAQRLDHKPENRLLPGGKAY
jgi:hypothetical protein